MAKKSAPAIDAGAVYSVNVLKRITVKGIRLMAGKHQLSGEAVIEAGEDVEVIAKVAEAG